MSISRNRLISKILDKDTGLVKGSLSDSDQIVSSGNKGIESTSAGTTVYATLANLPGSATTGDQAFVSSNNGLYIYNGSGWYKVALVNATPYWETEANTSYTFTIDTAITITLLADDSDGHLITYSATADSDANLFITISKDSDNGRIFTLTPDSENEAPGDTNSGTVTFKASDGISFASTVSTFTLNFINIIADSAETVLLMKAAGNSATNAAITYKNSSNVSTGFTEAGTPQAGTFSPYRSGGYSAYFDGASYIQFAASNDWGFGTSAWTIEFWYNSTDQDTHDPIAAFNASSPFAGWGVNIRSTGHVDMFFSDGSGSDGFDTVSGTTTINDGVWHHIVLTAPASSSTVSCYIDGVLAGSHTFTETASATGQILRVGADTNSSPARYMEGYLTDVRVVVGSQVYTSAFTPPTERLTAITGTVLLCCHLPYFGEGSTDNRDVTQVSNPETRPYGPYDYEPWTADDVGGSVYFDGTGDRLELASLDDLSGGSYTIEGWYYFDTDPNSATHLLWTLTDEGSTGYAQLQTVSGGTTLRLQQRGGSYLSDGSYDFVPNTWYHIATVWDGTNMKVYVNGTQALSSTTNVIQNAGNGLTLNGDGGGSFQFGGYIADFRIVTSAQYTAAFTPPTSPLSHTGSGTKLLMNNKSDANIYDAAAANTLLLNSGAQSSTTTRKFTTSSSILINGTDDKVTIQNLGIGGDMTFEGWFMQTTATDANYRTLLEASTYAGSTPFGLFTYNTQVQLWGLQSGVQITGSFSQNTWHHVAVVRNSGTWTLYIDGTSQGTNTNNGTYTFADTTDWNLGAQGSNASDFIGYLQDWRFSDRAVYTSNFTAPTAEFEL